MFIFVILVGRLSYSVNRITEITNVFPAINQDNIVGFVLINICKVSEITGASYTGRIFPGIFPGAPTACLIKIPNVFPASPR